MHLSPRSVSAAALAALFVCHAPASAQQTAQPQREIEGQQNRARIQQDRPQTQPDRGPVERTNRRGQAGSQADGKLAAAIIIDNQKEIAISQVAVQQAQNEQVKEFAQKMIEDHQKFVQQLEQMASSAGIPAEQLTLDSQGTNQRGQAADLQRSEQADATRPTQPAQTTRPGQPADATQPGQPAEATRRSARPRGLAEGGQGGVDFIRLKQEIARQNVQSLRQELQEKSGAEFDKCFMGAQVMAHIHMADTLKVSAQHASPQLQEILQQGLQTTQHHLTEAKQIAQRLEGAAEGGANANPQQGAAQPATPRPGNQF